MTPNPPPSDKTPQETTNRVAQTYFGVGKDPAARVHTIRGFLLGAAIAIWLIPLMFYVRYGEVPGLGWGVTVFIVAICVVAAIGLFLGPKIEFHTPVALVGDWLDRIGSFWLICCGFGPLLGWFVTAVFPLTPDSWQGLYLLRVVLTAGLPILTALPLLRYVRGKAARVALPLLVGITILPILSVINVSLDLIEGPVAQQVQPGKPVELYLLHTDVSLGVNR